MKNTAKKLLAVALALMLTLPLLAFNVSAGAELEPLYTVNFKGDSNMSAPKQVWDGFGIQNGAGVKASADGSSIDLKIESGKWAATGAELKGLYIQNGAYTFTFTVTASDDNEEVGILFDHATGFVVNPGQNTFRYTTHLTESTLIETTVYETQR